MTFLHHLLVCLQAKLKRAQRHMRLKEMAKKTRTTTSEEDDNPDSGECYVRGVNPLGTTMDIINIKG